MVFLSAIRALLRLALVPVVITGIPVEAQSEATGSLSGFVHDGSNGEALIGASVFLQGTQIGTLSNTSGYYVIPEIPVGDYILVCSFIGYEQFTRGVWVAADENEKIDISLPVAAITAAEVVVRADSMRTSQMLFEKPISGIRLSSRQVRAIPQVAEADLLRSLQTLPGIQSLSDFSSALYVRGGTPDQNLYMIDGSDVYNPEHTFGIFSTFNTDAIKQVELSKGGFGVEYGGRLSSVLNVTNLDGNRKQFEGTASLSPAFGQDDPAGTARQAWIALGLDSADLLRSDGGQVHRRCPRLLLLRWQRQGFPRTRRPQFTDDQRLWRARLPRCPLQYRIHGGDGTGDRLG